MAVVLKNIEIDRLEKDAKYLENLKANKGKAASVFGLCDMVLGKKKVSQDQVVLIDPDTNTEVNTPTDIKRVSLNYIVNLLTKKPPTDAKAELFKARKEQHE